MPFKFNPFTGTLDVVNAPPDQYIDGEVEYHSNLPVTVGTPAVNSAFLVRKGEGLYFISRKPAGIWVRELNNGNLDDWKFAGTFSDLYRDANFRIINDADASKEIAFSAASISSGTTRTLTVPDKSGTIATTDAGDMASGTLADARLSSNVPLKDAANTFSANQTLDGTNNVAPNQTAASGSSIMTRDLVDARVGAVFQRRITSSVSSFSTSYVNSTETLVVPAGTYMVFGTLFVSTASTTGGAQAEIVPSANADSTAAFLTRGTASSLNGGTTTSASFGVRVGTNLFEFLSAAFCDAPTLTSFARVDGVVTFNQQVTLTFRVRQRTAPDAVNAAVLQPNSFIRLVGIS
jgi:hypothetical protein